MGENSFLFIFQNSSLDDFGSADRNEFDDMTLTATFLFLYATQHLEFYSFDDGMSLINARGNISPP